MLQKALKLKPEFANAYYNLGNFSEQEGDRVEVQRCFELCLKFDPSNESALACLADAHIVTDAHDPLVRRAALVAQSSKNSDVFFALGKAYEQLAQNLIRPDPDPGP